MFYTYATTKTYLNITPSLITNSIENKLPNDILIRTKKIAPILLTTEERSECIVLQTTL